MPAKLDIVVTLRLALRAWWREFAPITFLGFAFLLAPDVLVRALTRPGPAPAELGWLTQTASAVCLMLFFAAVSFGTLSSLVGRPLDTRRFMALGLAAARPGLNVALVLGVGVVSLLIITLLGRGAGALGTLATAAAVVMGLWGLAALLPAVPLAIAEQLPPRAALARAVRLTEGNRGRLLGMTLIVGLALIPLGGVVNLVVFGAGVAPAEIERRAAALGLADPGFWIGQLSSLLILGALSTIPPVVYLQLAASRRG